jgi:tripeptidyl-peptidase-1
VSNPTSKKYAQYLTPQEVAKMVQPQESSFQAIKKWLSATIEAAPERIVRSASGDFLYITVTVAEAEKLLDTQYYSYRHASSTTMVHRVRHPETFVLPSVIQNHIDFIQPTTMFPPKSFLPTTLSKTKQPKKAAHHDRRFLTDPTLLRSQYNLGTTEGTANPNNTQHVASFLNNSFSPNDLQLFFSQYYPKGKGRTVAEVIGPNDESSPTLEASLDVEYIMAIGANVRTVFWSTPGTRPYPGGENEPFVTWLNGVVDGATSGKHPLPYTISVSYADEEFVIDRSFQKRADVEFMKLGAMGSSLFFGSGDNGVTGDKGVCPHNQFVPWWPASSPYVTAVGATEEYNQQGASFSGGGFSNFYTPPSYQTEAINAYKAGAGKNVPTHFYNQSGAGFPDVAANGLQFWTIIGGIPDEVGGTSAATPTVAGIVSLLNDARLTAGKKPLGLLNPLFYAHPEIFKDIESGTNSGYGGCGFGGFTAGVGWDPVTGMGSPKFDLMLKLVLSLP